MKCNRSCDRRLSALHNERHERIRALCCSAEFDFGSHGLPFKQDELDLLSAGAEENHEQELQD